MAERIMQVIQVVENHHPEPSQAPDRYLQPRQAQHRAPTNYEDLLGDAIERSFAAGVHDLAGLVDSLNRQGMTTRAGQPWTEANYGPEMAELSR
ncbi:recombinase-like helix-turn-helix domain-containing protein [Xenophilus azovorans]|uniref:recombinase-like helix-turn-helix domain-containing protein n=1 Tax=Xenophilus azovorans TaxID=151755 RepID=UPI003CCBFCF4